MELLTILAVLGGLVVGASLGYFGRTWILGRRREAARSEAEALLDAAREEKRDLLLEAKEEALQTRSTAEAEIRERRSELGRTERRLANREENSERRVSNLDRRERTLQANEDALEEAKSELVELKEKELEKLETIGGLSLSEAKELLIQRADSEIQHELALRYRDAEERAREEAEDKARRVVSQSIHRLASDVVSEVTVTTVPLPSDDMKGSSHRPRRTEH